MEYYLKSTIYFYKCFRIILINVSSIGICTFEIKNGIGVKVENLRTIPF